MYLVVEVVVIIAVCVQGDSGFRGPPGPPGTTLGVEGGRPTVHVPGPQVLTQPFQN